MSAVFDLLTSTRDADSLEDLNTLMSRFFDNHGFNKYAYVCVNHPADTKLNNSYVSNYPGQWEARYTERDYFTVDPLYELFQTRDSAFAWSFSLQKDSLNIQQKKFFLEANDFGCDKGVGIPIFSPNGGFSIVSLCSEYFHESELEGYLREVKKDLYLASMIHHQATMALLSEPKHYNSYDLTDRELEALYWLCQNKTYTEIGMIIGIGREGVSERLRKVYRKMQAVGRVDAVKKAIRSGLIVLN